MRWRVKGSAEDDRGERDFATVPNRARVKGQIVRGQIVRPHSVATQFGRSIREKGENAAETTVARMPSSGSRPTRAGVAHLELDLRLDHAVDLLDEAVVRREEAEPAAEGWGRVGVGGSGRMRQPPRAFDATCRNVFLRETPRRPPSRARDGWSLRLGERRARGDGDAHALSEELPRHGFVHLPHEPRAVRRRDEGEEEGQGEAHGTGCPFRAPGAPADVPATPHRGGVTADVRAAVRLAPRGSRNPRGRAANSTTRRGAF